MQGGEDRVVGVGFLKRLRGTEGTAAEVPAASVRYRPAWMTDGMSVTLYEGTEWLEVKGESRRQEQLHQIVRDMGREVPAVLAPEPDNPHDKNAVAVWVAGLHVGYLSREDAEVYQPGVMRLVEQEGKPVALMGRILGGDPDRPSLGIFLFHDPEDFGVRNDRAGHRARAANEEYGRVLTGSAGANLEWMDRLPTDRLAAIKRLRELLASEADPVERHFMYLELEELLYQCRDIFESALGDFEKTCLAHDAEMDTILPRLKESLGGIPALLTYKQAAIMKQKQHDFEAALWWAERGLSLYGDDGLRADYVEDLQERTAKYRMKLD